MLYYFFFCFFLFDSFSFIISIKLKWLIYYSYFNPKPEFFYYDDVEGIVCCIILPANAPVHRVVSSPQSSKEAAKKDACLKACGELHELRALTDYLLPDQGNGNDELLEDFSDSDSCDGEGIQT